MKKSLYEMRECTSWMPTCTPYFAELQALMSVLPLKKEVQETFFPLL